MSESSSEQDVSPESSIDQGARTILEVVASYPETEVGNDKVIIVNPGNGHGAYLLANEILNETNKFLTDKGEKPARILMPLLLGDTQKTILKEANFEHPELVLYDEELGNITKDMYFNNGSFSQHVTQIQKHYDGVQKMLDQRLAYDAPSFQARSLANNELVNLSPRNIVATIDAGAKVIMRAPERYFAFPYLIAAMLKQAHQEQQEAGSETFGLSQTDLKAQIAHMIEIERDYSRVFIPLVNPFSYQYANDLSQQPTNVMGHDIDYTPGMTNATETRPTTLERDGLYASFSGTGMGHELLVSVVKAAKEMGIDVYTPPSTNIEGAIKAPHDIFQDERIVAWLMRAGFGGMWKAFARGIPVGITPPELGEDPETVLNARTVEALRLGKILHGGIITPEIFDDILRCSPGVNKLNKMTEDLYGTKNGALYIGRVIGQDLLQRPTAA